MTTPVTRIMTKTLKTIPIGSRLAEAMDIMAEARIRHLPVVNEAEDIVGIISHRDIKFSKSSQNIPVEFIMSTPVEYLEEGTPLKSAIFKMLEKKISCLLISDKKGDAVGIITTDDILWFLSQQLEADSKKSQPLLSIFNLETVGEVAKMLSQMGI
jgi:CBS domain-containing protein